MPKEFKYLIDEYRGFQSSEHAIELELQSEIKNIKREHESGFKDEASIDSVIYNKIFSSYMTEILHINNATQELNHTSSEVLQPVTAPTAEIAPASTHETSTILSSTASITNKLVAIKKAGGDNSQTKIHQLGIESADNKLSFPEVQQPVAEPTVAPTINVASTAISATDAPSAVNQPNFGRDIKPTEAQNAEAPINPPITGLRTFSPRKTKTEPNKDPPKNRNVI